MDRDRDPRTRLEGNASSAEARRTGRQFLRATARSAATLSAFGLRAACGGAATTPTSPPAPTQQPTAGAAVTTAATSSRASAGVTTSATTGAASTAAPAPAARQGGELMYALATKYDTLDPSCPGRAAPPAVLGRDGDRSGRRAAVIPLLQR